LHGANTKRDKRMSDCDQCGQPAWVCLCECPHKNRSLVWVPVGTPGVSTRQLRYQCQHCWEYVGGSQRHALATPDTPEVDPNQLIIRDERRERKWLQGRQEFTKWEQARQQEDEDWWRRTTNTWKQINGGNCGNLFSNATTAFVRVATRHRQHRFITSPIRMFATSFCGN
jgi:hypothetical protein